MNTSGNTEMVKVKIEGQYYWAEGRVKQISNYDMEVEIPMSEVHRALWYIQRIIVNPMLMKRNERATSFRTCKIVSQLPACPIPPQPAPNSEEPVPERPVGADPLPAPGPQVVPEPEFPLSSSGVELDDGEETSTEA